MSDPVVDAPMYENDIEYLLDAPRKHRQVRLIALIMRAKKSERTAKDTYDKLWNWFPAGKGLDWERFKSILDESLAPYRDASSSEEGSK